mmetsp:Transcript_15289/g.35170  ORF Transcript_15289/g.35170 Transcript_15289/m.35170 type:complete len:217 (-) Transcript_15289:674-1324(-)
MPARPVPPPVPPPAVPPPPPPSQRPQSPASLPARRGVAKQRLARTRPVSGATSAGLADRAFWRQTRRGAPARSRGARQWGRAVRWRRRARAARRHWGRVCRQAPRAPPRALCRRIGRSRRWPAQARRRAVVPTSIPAQYAPAARARAPSAPPHQCNRLHHTHARSPEPTAGPIPFGDKAATRAKARNGSACGSAAAAQRRRPPPVWQLRPQPQLAR